ncbi:amino acid ABC transporter substrate-binding protein [Agrobacterium genomosp. 3 str. RTP8]|uniref:ABC transporter substrate-binding protein n=1 Tax=Agrobacterium tomkonis TaxID=1183410 RepID=UPI001CD96129|nr:amino acid ABC transporter substrate-binding protein [Agrobacterium tomkonis RTP8]
MSDEILIGSMLPLSGAGAPDANEFRNGAQLAISEINAKGGVLGRKLKLVCADSGNQNADAVLEAARWLIDERGVNAIINGYNIGSQNAEYEPIADAEIIYIHANTLIQHHETVASDRYRYFGCFMGNPADYWYGQGFIKLLSWLRDTGQWVPSSNRLAIISGTRPYSIVIANAMRTAATEFGWEAAFGPEIVETPRSDWREVLDRARKSDPAVLINTHFYQHDLVHFQRQFLENPMKCLVYLQYGGLHHSFADATGESANGVIIGTVVGLLQDEIGMNFANRYTAAYGISSSPQIGCVTYGSVRHYAHSVAVAGCVGAPYENSNKNREVACALMDQPFRSVTGTINYHRGWQAAIPYPDFTADPSLGMPHLFFQTQRGVSKIIAPAPYNTGQFEPPSWLR